MQRTPGAAVLIVTLMCGVSAAPPAPEVVPVAVHDVSMVITADGAYAFEPAVLAIRPGDRVRWINVSGAPHNVAFYADSVPAGAGPVLNVVMPERLGNQDLVGKLLFDEGEVYEIAFTGVPDGRYRYYCTPHEFVGMQATITVAR